MLVRTTLLSPSVSCWSEALLRACRLTAFRGSCVLEVGQIWDSEILLCNRLMLILSNRSGSSRESTLPARILVIHSDFLKLKPNTPLSLARRLIQSMGPESVRAVGSRFVPLLLRVHSGERYYRVCVGTARSHLSSDPDCLHDFLRGGFVLRCRYRVTLDAVRALFPTLASKVRRCWRIYWLWHDVLSFGSPKSPTKQVS